MKKIFLLSLISIMVMKCNWATDPTPRPSSTITDSKHDSVFLYEYEPQLPYLSIEGKDYKIKEAWVEHPHLERNEGHIPSKKAYDFVMTFVEHPADSLDFNKYTKTLALGDWKIWFFLTEKEYRQSKDTLILYYREKLNDKEQKSFLLFRKSEK
jgi:hypothetical protein